MTHPRPFPDVCQTRGASAPAVSGRRLVAGLVALGIAAGITGIAWQRGQTRRCLGFYGAEVARAITTAPHVELWSGVRPGDRPGTWLAATRRDVSAARGLVHLRRGLVEDANFLAGTASTGDGDRGGGEAADFGWSHVLVFSRGPVSKVDTGAGTAVALCFDGGGGAPRRLTVVGRPGVLPVGRIGRGIADWIEATASAETP